MGEPVYLVADLPLALAVEEALLGSSWDVSSSPVPVKVVLPRRPRESLAYLDLTLVAPEANGDEIAVEEWWEDYLTDDEGEPIWGSVNHFVRDDDRVLSAAVYRALVIADYDGPVRTLAHAKFAAQVGAQVEPWVAAMAEWLEVLAGQVITAARPATKPGPASISSHPLRVNRATGNAEPLAGPPRYVARGRDRPVMTRAVWATAVDRVTSGAPPPLSHLLLRDARVARIMNDHHRAVIDATSAVEVALSTWLQGHLTAGSMDAEDVKEAMKRRQRGGGVMELYDFHMAVAGPVDGISPGRLSNHLAAVRNRVAHGGDTPTAAENTAAIEVATALVTAVAPLPRT